MIVVADLLRLLVPTKLAPPPASATWIQRTRLIMQLNASTPARLLTVVAPAGFGKTTLVAQWLMEGMSTPDQGRQVGNASVVDDARTLLPATSAWLTLDEHDQCPLSFLTYLVGAIDRVTPGMLGATFDVLNDTPVPQPYLLIQALLVDLSALPLHLTLVLDNYHVITADVIHQTVAYLLRHLPAHCQLVIISRTELALPLARLRAERQLAELRAADLRFTAAEIDALLTILTGSAPSAAQLAMLQQQTEGWPMALRLMAMATPSGGSNGLLTATRQIAAYLADEVLAQQPLELQQILLALAIPERFCAHLCTALLDQPATPLTGEQRIDQLVRANLFLIPLDEQQCWYRFQQLFRDLLLHHARQTLGEQRIRDLHRRAARWLTTEGLNEDALRHLLAAGDEDAAAELTERHLAPTIKRNHSAGQPDAWLRLLPTSLIERRPGLTLIAAHLAVLNMDLADLRTRLAQVDTLLADPDLANQATLWPSFHADLAALRDMLCYWESRSAKTINTMRAALAQRPSRALAVQTLLQLGLAYIANGAYAEGLRLIEPGLPEARALLDPLHTLYQPNYVASTHQLAGELAVLEHDAQQLSELVIAYEFNDLWKGYAAASLGMIAYERSNLSVAAAQFGTLVNQKYRVSDPGYLGGLIGLALVATAQGSLNHADQLAHQALAFADEVGGVFLRHQALGCAVRVALASGDRAAALRAAAAIRSDLNLGFNMGLEAPRLSQVRALIAAGDPTQLAQAEGLLSACLSEIEALHNVRLLINALVAQALLSQAQHRPVQARAALRRAVNLAAPRGLVRSFIDCGPPLIKLLQDLRSENIAPAYTDYLLSLATLDPSSRGQPLVVPPAPALPELLTRRESEILTLLARRWSDKEIATELVIASNTVRKHTSTIYQKLGVGSRREAVIAARTLGILPTEKT